MIDVDTKKEKEVKIGGILLMIAMGLALIMYFSSSGISASNYSGYAVLGVLFLMGLISTIHPKTGELLLKALSNIGSNTSEGHVSQKQKNTKSSTQIFGNGNVVTIHHNDKKSGSENSE